MPISGALMHDNPDLHSAPARVERAGIAVPNRRGKPPMLDLIGAPDNYDNLAWSEGTDRTSGPTLDESFPAEAYSPQVILVSFRRFHFPMTARWHPTCCA
jgi:hypothetical protein